LLAPLIAVLAALSAAQAVPPSGGPATPVGEQSSPAEGSESAAESRFADPVESGIPFQPSVSPPRAAPKGTTLDLGVNALVRTWTLAYAGSGQGLASNLEVTPGVGVSVSLPAFLLGAGYGARITVPFNAVGSDLAVLQRFFLRADWTLDPLWTLGLGGGVTFGQNSQLLPVVSPGAPGVPPASLSPIRTFTTYPFIGADATLSASGQLSHRSRLRLSVGYVDNGGVGEAGQAAQPRMWGPTAEAAFDWDVSSQGNLVTTLSFIDSNVVGGQAMRLLTLREAWSQRWTLNLETTISGGVALSNTDTERFAGASHVLPVAAAGLRYFTDVRHTFRLWVDVALAPYVDAYADAVYQRLTGTVGFDWYPAQRVSVGFNLATAYVPQGAPSPQSYGTGGLAIAWAPWAWLTLNAGGFLQAQPTEQGAFDLGAFRQWTVYASVTVSDKLSL
jgi:hypothetical protein